MAAQNFKKFVVWLCLVEFLPGLVEVENFPADEDVAFDQVFTGGALVKTLDKNIPCLLQIDYSFIARLKGVVQKLKLLSFFKAPGVSGCDQLRDIEAAVNKLIFYGRDGLS